ncbi:MULTISPECIES: hypothetical protein [Pseudomonas]|uniref:hypothetical protein n=1 Tax=Pseudomonas TaxID=286 RepID=UPI00119857EA|nr:MULTISPECIES: hypothetical protein [Pseudomonas]MDT3749759.1 hypothetical protein [Pseudomonas kurunegalensis]QDY37592.1 hypothetical protein CHR26_15535 [Pseudomonas putida]
MAKYKIAHVHRSGQDMIVFPLDSSFGRKTGTEQQEIVDSLQQAAWSANLAGTVVAIWQSGNRVHFHAPTAWHPFFRSPNIWGWVMANINKELTI